MKRGKETNRRWALQDAKNKFSEVVNAAASGEPQVVTRRGVDTAVVISPEVFQKLSAGRVVSHATFAHCLLAMPSADHGDFDRIPMTIRDLDS